MDLNLKKPTLNLKRQVLELTKNPPVVPIKMQNGQYVRKALATTKKEAMASKMV